MPDSPSVKRDVAEAHLALAYAGHSDLVWGHASIRDQDGRGVWMKASGWGLEEISDERVLLVGPDGSVLDGEGARHIEYHIHTSIMEARPDVQAVVHTHAPAAAVFASLGVPLRAISHDGTLFADPDVPRFHETGNLIATQELGKSLASALGPAHGVLLPQHGLVAVGPSIAEAVMHAVLLHRACEQNITAAQAGGPRMWSPPEEVRAKAGNWTAAQLEAGYSYLVRRGTAIYR